MAIHKTMIAIRVVIAVKVSSDMNVLDNSSLLFLAAAISRIPTVVMPIIERKTK